MRCKWGTVQISVFFRDGPQKRIVDPSRKNRWDWAAKYRRRWRVGPKDVVTYGKGIGLCRKPLKKQNFEIHGDPARPQVLRCRENCDEKMIKAAVLLTKRVDGPWSKILKVKHFSPCFIQTQAWQGFDCTVPMPRCLSFPEFFKFYEVIWKSGEIGMGI